MKRKRRTHSDSSFEEFDQSDEETSSKRKNSNPKKNDVPLTPIHDEDGQSNTQLVESIVLEEAQEEEENTNEPKRRLFIEKLEVEGFKSYREREVIGVFDSKFTCIVGPNGSGKSNVVDALCFIFGYESKLLRSKNLSSLINNSIREKNGKAIGICYFRAESETYPVNKDEVHVEVERFCVKREAYSTGGSSYFIKLDESDFMKKKRAEIRELLHCYGLDLEHSERFIILQHNTANLAKKKPLELLDYLEGIIGTKDIKKRLEEIDQKILQNYEDQKKVNNEINLLKDQSENLSSSVSVFNEYVKTSNRKKELEIRFFGNCSKDCEEKKNTLMAQLSKLNIEKKEEEINVFKKKVKEKSKEFKKINKKLKDKKKEIDENDKLYINKFEKYTNLENSLKKIKKKIQKDEKERKRVKKEKKKQYERRTQLENELEDLQIKKKDLINEINLLEKEIGEQKKNNKKTKSEKEIKELRSNIKKLELDRKFQSLKNKKELLDQTEKLSPILSENNLESITKEIKELENKKLEIEVKIKNYLKELQQIKQNEVDIKRKIDSIQKKLDEFNMKKNLLSSELTSISNFQIGSNEESEEKGIDIKPSQYQKRFISIIENFKTRGITLGRLCDLIKLKEKKFSICVNKVLAGIFRNTVVCSTRKMALILIKFFKEKKIGLISCQVLDEYYGESKNKFEFEGDKRAKRLGLVRMIDTLNILDIGGSHETGEKIKRVMEKICRYWWIAENRKTALNLSVETVKGKKGVKKIRRNIVTLQGEIFRSGGEIRSSGSTARVERYVKSEDERRNIEEENKENEENEEKERRKMESIKTNISSLERLILENNSIINEMNEELEKIKKKEFEIKREVEKLKERKKNYEKKVEIEVEKFEDLKKEVDEGDTKNEIEIDEGDMEYLLDYNNKLEKMKKKMNELKEKMEKEGNYANFDLEGKKKVLEETLEDVEFSLVKTKKIVKKIIPKKINEKNEIINQLKKKVIEQREKLKQMEVDLDKSKEECEELENSVTEKKLSLNELEKEMKDIKIKLNDFERKFKRSKESIEKSLKEKRKIRKEIEKIEKALREYEKKLKEVMEKKFNFNDFKEEEEIEEEDEEEIEDKDLEFEIERLEKMIFEFNTILDMKKVKQHFKKKKKIKILMEKIKELKKRNSTFLEKRESLSIKRFEKFHSNCKSINKNLSSILKRSDANGYLKYPFEKKDCFQEGVQYICKPEGFEWKSFNKLSGGQQAFCQVGLTMALLDTFRSCLVIFDEIDANLDMKAVEKVSYMLKEWSERMQFIVITLKWRMYERADRLIGVYQLDGTTKTVTKSFSDTKTE